MEQNLKQKTGKDLQQWKTALGPMGFNKHGEIMAYLKGECGLSHGYANFIALKFREADAASHNDADLISAQYKGKESLLILFEHLRQQIQSLGIDIEMVPKKAAVSFRRKRQFALIQPSTKTRIDLGLKLDNTAFEGRLEASGPFGSMCSHRIQISETTLPDDEVFGWIKQAYDQAG
ncbi:DUF5655 domain-containing protein [Lacimicrobium alkaliphilum]|uniref:Phosphoribosylformylglycinamidine synthase n=1 Tax=Lacimicrobium alkaliphilum TaxID=1526571 RepID=A0A0U3AXU4_9ALTE|nr:DUF5655 domain-containing protein [Lacimicrobium alkaliphilum]ALS98943.1 phosphoribosylformylglycinamidine synthase [Lacimicrobium alkaliphilum]